MADFDPIRELTRREALRRAGIGGAVLALPGLLAACGGSDSGSRASSNGGTPAGGSAEIDSVTWTLNSSPPTLDLATGFTLDALLAIITSLEGLVTLDDEMALKPLLAESWTEDESLTRYVFTVRDGVTFWDGSPLTVEDVAYSLTRHMDPDVGSQLAGDFAVVRSVDVSGERELSIRLKQPDPLFLFTLALSFVTPKAYTQEQGKKLGTPGKEVRTIGTGPFQITGFDDAGVTLERREDYWGEKPKIRNATLKIIDNPQTQQLAMQSEETEGIFDFQSVPGKDWEKIPNVRTEYAAGLWIVSLSFDLSMEPWNDVHVRRAIAHATDRAGYVKAFTGGHARVAKSLVPPEVWTGLADEAEVKAIYEQLPDYAFDIEAAKRELAQSAYPDGFTAKLTYSSDDQAAGRAFVNLSEALKPLGIELELNEVPHAKWQATLYGHEDMGLLYRSSGPGGSDPHTYLSAYLPSSAAVKNSGNTANFKDPDVDRLLDEQAETGDKAERVKLLTEILTTAGEELPYLPLWWQDTAMAINDALVMPGFNSLYYLQNWLAKVQAKA